MKIKGGARRVTAILESKVGKLWLRKDRKGNIARAFMVEKDRTYQVRARHARKALQYLQAKQDAQQGGSLSEHNQG